MNDISNKDNNIKIELINGRYIISRLCSHGYVPMIDIADKNYADVMYKKLMEAFK